MFLKVIHSNIPLVMGRLVVFLSLPWAFLFPIFFYIYKNKLGIKEVGLYKISYKLFNYLYISAIRTTLSSLTSIMVNIVLWVFSKVKYFFKKKLSTFVYDIFVKVKPFLRRNKNGKIANKMDN